MVNKLLLHLKEHQAIYLSSLLLSLIVSAPLIAFPLISKETYKGINIAHFDRLDEHFYLSRAKEILEGHNLGSPTLREGKDQPDTYFNYGEKLMLMPFRWIGVANHINVVTLYNYYNFVGVFLVIVLVYFLVWQISRSKLLSLVSAVFVIGGYHIVYSGSFFYDDFNFYARAMYPYISSLIFFSYLNFLVRSLNTSNPKHLVLSSLAFGLMFYISFYGWSFILALNAVLFLTFLIRKDSIGVKKVTFVSIGGLLIGAFNLYQMFQFYTSDIGRELALFIGATTNHHPLFSKLGFFALLLFAIFWFFRKDDKNLLLILGFLLSGWVALNQQVLTGTVIQYGHYYWYFIVPLIILSTLYIIWFLISSESLRKILFLSTFILIFLHAGIGQYRSFLTTFEAKNYEQSYQPIIDYLSGSQESGVILAPLNRSGLLFTIYTNHDLFWSPSSVWSYNKLKRFQDVVSVYDYLDGQKTVLQAKEINNILNLYNVNYIVWDKNVYSNWDLHGLSADEIMHSENIYLYALN